jgi:hypothetical protein
VPALIAILRAIQPESDFAVIFLGSVQALRYFLRYGPDALASLVAITAKSEKSRGDRALDVLQALRGQTPAEPAKAPSPAAGLPPWPSEAREVTRRPADRRPPRPEQPPARISGPRRWRRPASRGP